MTPSTSDGGSGDVEKQMDSSYILVIELIRLFDEMWGIERKEKNHGWDYIS